MVNRIKRSIRFYRQYVHKTDTVTLAYYFILGIVPMITLILLGCRLVHVDTNALARSLSMILPEQLSGTITGLVAGRKTSMVSTLTILISIYVSSKGTYQMILAVDKMYHTRQEMSLFNLQFHAIVDILLIMAMFGAALVGVAFMPAILLHFGLGKYANLKWLFEIVGVYLMLLIVYKVVPSTKVRFRDCLLGAFCALVLFAGIVIFYKVYLMFANMSNVYGDFASLALMLMSVEYFCQALYFGFAVNALIYIE